jgi:hypothetical protein
MLCIPARAPEKIDAPSPIRVRNPVIPSSAGPSTFSRTSPKAFARSSMGPSAEVAAWISGPILP